MEETSRNHLQSKFFFFCGHHTLQKISGILLNYLMKIIYISCKLSGVGHSESRVKNQISLVTVSQLSYFQFCLSLATFCSDICHTGPWQGVKTLPKVQPHGLSSPGSSSPALQLTRLSWCHTRVTGTKFFHGALGAQLMESAAAPRCAKPQELAQSKLLFPSDTRGERGEAAQRIQKVMWTHGCWSDGPANHKSHCRSCSKCVQQLPPKQIISQGWLLSCGNL